MSTSAKTPSRKYGPAQKNRTRDLHGIRGWSPQHTKLMAACKLIHGDLTEAQIIEAALIEQVRRNVNRFPAFRKLVGDA